MVQGGLHAHNVGKQRPTAKPIVLQRGVEWYFITSDEKALLF